MLVITPTATTTPVFTAASTNIATAAPTLPILAIHSVLAALAIPAAPAVLAAPALANYAPTISALTALTPAAFTLNAPTLRSVQGSSPSMRLVHRWRSSLLNSRVPNPPFTTPSNATPSIKQQAIYLVLAVLQGYRVIRKIIYRKARAASKIEYSELAKEGGAAAHCIECSKKASPTTAAKRPKLNRGHAAKRLQFARQYRQFAWGRRTLKFSDECLVQKGSGANQEWCFRFPWEKWKPEMILEYGTSRKPAQMVWASIWLDERGRARRSNLVIMERDSDAPAVATAPKVTLRP
ncbi:hypothetical protein A1F94_007128 [Pyrenophora tritici-repentis]|nr:hypothetical protein A1F94_007128 [Pyrenophora tritici-repentis]